MRQAQVKDTYDYCRRVTKQASKTFYWGSLFLPPPKRQAVWAIYALCRIVDDIVDESPDPISSNPGHLVGSMMPVKELDYWRCALQELYQSGSPGGHPVLQAWYDMLQHYPVPLQPALELLDGVEMDLTTNRYRTFDELYIYCYRVAGTVGLLTSYIFGYQDASALEHAVELGVALQLTNILRDIGEDARRDRIYLPQEEMERFGYCERDLMNNVINQSFCDLVGFEMARTEEFYQSAQPGISLLSPDCRLAVQISGTLYHDILDRIRLNNYNVFTKRANVPLQTKLVTASAHWFMQQFEPLMH